ncbi:MAG: HIT domain-containing protein [Acidobacteriota bacterium]
MELLWSPWRYEYVTSVADSCGCVFCDALHEPDSTSLVLHRGRTAFIILNLYPYNSGHLMIVPARHIATLGLASAEERCELMDLVQLAEQALTETYRPQGLNVGMNLGRAAGAGIVDHLHIHVVPRWSGDTNFMSVLGSVRVMPEDLKRGVDRLRPVFRQLTGQKTEDRRQKTEG